jgi:hypothetical protein
MPNGKGSLECCYCEHYRCHNPEWVGYDAVHLAGECLRYHTRLPDTMESSLSRVCSDFQPNERYTHDSILPVEERFAFFPLRLVRGVLYGYHYTDPPGVQQIAVLAADGGQKDP